MHFTEADFRLVLGQWQAREHKHRKLRDPTKSRSLSSSQGSDILRQLGVRGWNVSWDNCCSWARCWARWLICYRRLFGAWTGHGFGFSRLITCSLLWWHLGNCCYPWVLSLKCAIIWEDIRLDVPLEFSRVLVCNCVKILDAETQ